jgi:hypothetical protein
MKIGDDDEGAASLGTANRRDAGDQPGKGQGRGEDGQANEKRDSSCHLLAAKAVKLSVDYGKMTLTYLFIGDGGGLIALLG